MTPWPKKPPPLLAAAATAAATGGATATAKPAASIVLIFWRQSTEEEVTRPSMRIGRPAAFAATCTLVFGTVVFLVHRIQQDERKVRTS